MKTYLGVLLGEGLLLDLLLLEGPISLVLEGGREGGGREGGVVRDERREGYTSFGGMH